MKKKPRLSGMTNTSNHEPAMEFISDSPEQIRDSIKRIGYRIKLDRAFMAAIARVKKAY